MPVADIPRVADPVFQTLGRLGVDRPIVLSEHRRRSQRIEYRVPATAHRRWPHRIVRLRFRVTLDRRRCGTGAGYVNLLTGLGSSAQAEIDVRRREGKLAVRWSLVNLRGERRGHSHRSTVTLAMTNYMLAPDSRPGRHTLRFQLQESGRFHVRRVVIDRSSGLRLTSDPPYPVRMRVGLASGQPLTAGRPITVAVQVYNRGSRPVHGVRVVPRGDRGLEIEKPPGFGRWPTIGGGRLIRRSLTATPTTAGRHVLHISAESNFGSPEAQLPLTAHPRVSGTRGPSPFLIAGFVVAGLGAALVLVRLPRRRPRR